MELIRSFKWILLSISLVTLCVVCSAQDYDEPGPTGPGEHTDAPPPAPGPTDQGANGETVPPAADSTESATAAPPLTPAPTPAPTPAVTHPVTPSATHAPQITSKATLTTKLILKATPGPPVTIQQTVAEATKTAPAEASQKPELLPKVEATKEPEKDVTKHETVAEDPKMTTKGSPAGGDAPDAVVSTEAAYVEETTKAAAVKTTQDGQVLGDVVAKKTTPALGKTDTVVATTKITQTEVVTTQQDVVTTAVFVEVPPAKIDQVDVVTENITVEAQTTDAATTQVAEEQVTTIATTQVESRSEPPLVKTTQSEESLLTTRAEAETTPDVTQQPTEAEPKSDDPCDNYELLEKNERHMSNKAEPDQYTCDNLEKKWYAFKYQGQWAEIPSEAIKQGYCGTKLPFRLNLGKDQSLPEFNQTISTEICTAYEIEKNMDECVLKKDIQIKGCGDYHIYFLQNLANTCTGAICTQVHGEDIPYSALANPPPTTTAVPTTVEPLPINQRSRDNLTKEEESGLVTAFFSFPNGTFDREKFILFEKRFSAILTKYLNERPEPTETPEPTKAMAEKVDDTTQSAVTKAAVASEQVTGFVEKVDAEKQNAVSQEDKQGQPTGTNLSGLRRKRAAGTDGAKYDEDGLVYVEPTPRINKDGLLEMTFFVRDKDGNVIPADVLKKAIEEMENPSDDPEIKLDKVIVGAPGDPSTAPVSEKKDIWEAHMGLWITIIVLCAVCIITLIICCLCFRCCDTEDAQPEKSPLYMEEGKKTPSVVIENPVSDEEITRDEAPMVEHENPALTSNGGGQHLKKDEDNGWVVPLDQLTDEEKKKAEVENTKL